MSRFILGIGLPGSGKTTYLKTFCDKNGFKYLSPDYAREKLNGDAGVQANMKEVWQIIDTEIEKCAEENIDVVLDATFVKYSERIKRIKESKDLGFTSVDGLFFDTPFEICLERNQNRERVVPEHAMQRMCESLIENFPKKEDGFDTLFRVDENMEFKEIKAERKHESRENGKIK